jgi:hypothetical protein
MHQTASIRVPVLCKWFFATVPEHAGNQARHTAAQAYG